MKIKTKKSPVGRKRITSSAVLIGVVAAAAVFTAIAGWTASAQERSGDVEINSQVSYSLAGIFSYFTTASSRTAKAPTTDGNVVVADGNICNVPAAASE